MKRFLYTLWRGSGLASLTRLLTRSRLKILLYHGVVPSAGEGMFNYRRKFVAAQSFEKQVAYLAKYYTILPLEEAVRRLKEETLPRHSLAITFDDGYRNNYDYAFPILKKFRVPATIFLATEFVFKHVPLWVDRLEFAFDTEMGPEDTVMERKRLDANLRRKLKKMPNEERLHALEELERSRGTALGSVDADPRYAPLTDTMIQEMRGSGITFGAHSHTHPILSSLGEEDAYHEIIESEGLVKEHSFSVSSIFCYPNGQPGDWLPAHERFLAEKNFLGALTTIEGINDRSTHLFRLRRYTMDDTDSWGAFIAAESGFRGILQRLKKIWRS